MYRKILSFMLILCLCAGIIPSTNIYAMEDQGNVESNSIVVGNIEMDEQGGYEESGIDIPQNGSEVFMEDVTETQPAVFRLPAENEEKVSNKRYTVLLLDISYSVTFYDYDGSVLYTADTAFPYVQASSKKFIEDIGSAPGKNYIAIV